MLGYNMKKHRVKKFIKKDTTHTMVVFRDGGTVCVNNIQAAFMRPNMRVVEHTDKNGKTVAYSWDENIKFVAPQPLYFDASVDFMKKLKPLDRVAFNNAVVATMHYKTGRSLFPNTEKFAHNLVLLGFKKWIRTR